MMRGPLVPRIPTKMSISGCTAALWRVTAHVRLSALRFHCEWPDPPAGVRGTPNPGEALDAFTWRVGNSVVTVGTEDGEFLSSRARQGAGVPVGLADELSLSTVKYTATGMVVPLSHLEPQETVEVHFLVAWSEGHTDESPSTWFAVEQDHKYVVESLKAGRHEAG